MKLFALCLIIGIVICHTYYIPIILKNESYDYHLNLTTKHTKVEGGIVSEYLVIITSDTDVTDTISLEELSHYIVMDNF